MFYYSTYLNHIKSNKTSIKPYNTLLNLSLILLNTNPI